MSTTNPALGQSFRRLGEFLPVTMDRLKESGIGPVVIVAVLLILVLRLVLTVFYNVWVHPLAKVPGPLLAQVFSSYLTPAQMRLDRAQTLATLHQRYGPVVRVGPNEVSISDWTFYRKIYGAKASAKTDNFYRAATFLGHENIFSMRNKAQHYARRKLQSQPYSQQAILENEALIADKANIMVRRIIKAAKNSPSRKVADVFHFCGLFSLEVILKCAFNRDYGESPEGSSSTLLKAMDASAILLPLDAAFPFLKKYGIGRHIPGPIGHAYRQFDVWVGMTTLLLNDFQQQEKALDKTHRFMATPLLVNKDDFLGRLMNKTEIVEEAMGITFAGSGTTSSTLTYLLYALSRPEAQGIQERLREEVQASGDSLNEVKDLPLLNAIINEGFRLYPTIISTLPRVLDVPVAVPRAGSVLPKGTVVGMQNYIHHRDTDLFPEPDKFLPDRWLKGDSATTDMNAALTPFSLGPRNCIGQNLARAELYLATSKIFKKLKLTLNSAMKESDMEMEDRFNIAPKRRRLLLDVEVLN